jgi:glycosyltransferase involved in cell wall biosynthesis
MEGQGVMIVCHIVTPNFSPQEGGLEASAYRIARTLARSENVVVVVHVLAASYPIRSTTYNGLELSLIGIARKPLEEPLAAAGGDALKQYKGHIERARLDYLLLRNAVEDRMFARPNASHVILSFFMSQAGGVSQRLADTLGIPHILGVRGSDFSLHLHDNIQLSGIATALTNCARVVTTNDEQRRVLHASYGVGDKTTTIHNSLEPSQLQTTWEEPQGEPVVLFSDSGYSFKKATHVLMQGFEYVRDQGVRARLIVAGSVESSTMAYWNDKKKEMAERLGSDVEFREHLSLEEVGGLLETSHVYCSATLGEGCSLARAAALVAGMPIVTTRCGEMPDLAADASHVALARPGDSPEYSRLLHDMCLRVAAGTIQVDGGQVDRWRTYFRPERESREWRAIVGDVAGQELIPMDPEPGGGQ